MNHLYGSVFGNQYLRKKIYSLIYVLQHYDNSLRYSDIADIRYMIKYGHIGLLKDKVQRQELLFNSGTVVDLYPLIDRDLELFKTLYHTHKATPTNRSLFFEDVIAKNNFECVRWVCESGLAYEVTDDHFKFTTDSDPAILDYLITNKWYTVTHESVLKIYKKSYSPFSPSILQVFKQHTPNPISSEQATAIINSLLSVPIPLVFETLLPLFQKDIQVNLDSRLTINIRSLSTLPILKYLLDNNLAKEKESMVHEAIKSMDTLVNISAFIDQIKQISNNNSNSISQLLTKFFPVQFTKEDNDRLANSFCDELYSLPIDALHALIDHGCKLPWFNNLVKMGNRDALFSLWRRFQTLDQIKFIGNEITFQPDTTLGNQQKVYIDFRNAMDVHIIEFLLEQGYSPDTIKQYIRVKPDSIDIIANQRHTMARELDLLIKHINQGIIQCDSILSICLERGNNRLFKSIYTKTQDKLSELSVSQLLKRATALQQLEPLSLLQLQSGAKPLTIAQINVQNPKLSYIKSVMASHPELAEQFQGMLKNFIIPNRYDIVKYMLSTFHYGALGSDIMALLSPSNPAMVDLFYRHQDLAFNTHSQWEDLIVQCASLPNHQSAHLIQYFVNNKIVTSISNELKSLVILQPPTPVLVAITPLLDPVRHKRVLEGKSFFDHRDLFNCFMYLIDNQVYDTVTPYIDLIVRDAIKPIKFWNPNTLCRCLEYLIKNQHIFKNPSNPKDIINQIQSHPIVDTTLLHYIDTHYKNQYV
ncbi:hypothetical protein CYY_008887 [Polysphondylium violaceum]|uniref:Uncharacterized protein n=1 Tax=Polysphondylium violaceum TaxID=133409 RepID=A0A8J4PL08_9MYCE|nr:hypothetical protein CYY_008887 [Polysphondylium violaceum]